MQNSKKFVVAVDGPAGTGKSTATKRISKLLGLIHVDTGALYRGIAYQATEAGFGLEFDESDHAAITKIAQRTKFEFQRIPGKARMEFRKSDRIGTSPSSRPYSPRAIF